MRERYVSVTVPDKCNPLVRRLFAEMHKQKIGVLDMADRSGVNKNTLKDWRTRTTPRIADIEACFNVLGLTLTVTNRRTNNDPRTGR